MTVPLAASLPINVVDVEKTSSCIYSLDVRVVQYVRPTTILKSSETVALCEHL